MQFQPSPKEEEAILILQRVMSKYLDYDFYDVEDDLDEEEKDSEQEITEQLFRPSSISQHVIKTFGVFIMKSCRVF